MCDSVSLVNLPAFCLFFPSLDISFVSLRRQGPSSAQPHIYTHIYTRCARREHAGPRPAPGHVNLRRKCARHVQQASSRRKPGSTDGDNALILGGFQLWIVCCPWIPAFAGMTWRWEMPQPIRINVPISPIPTNPGLLNLCINIIKNHE